MQMIKGGSFELPIDYMAYIPSKNERKAYFKSIMEFYKTEIPNFTLVYAYLVPWDKMVGNIIKKYNEYHGKIDYVMIFTVPATIDGTPIYVIEAPIFGTERSCVGFQYAKEKGLLNEYRNMVIETAARLTQDRFYEFLYQMSYTELYEGYPSRETSAELSNFYKNLPKSVKLQLQQDVKPDSDEVVLDTNAAPLTGVLSMNPNFWTTPENRDAMVCNSMILSTYYNKR